MKKQEVKKRDKYEKPLFEKEKGMTFTKRIWQKFGGTSSCMQCSGCHGCR